MTELLQRIVLILLPMYFANASALFFGGRHALDFGKKFFDGFPLLGKGKTIEGTIGGMISGILITIIIVQALGESTEIVTENYLFFGMLSTIGAVTGDVAASFIKRRLGKEQGANVFLLDQLDFLFGGLLFGSIVFIPTIQETAIITIITIFVHLATNYIAFKIKMKNVPW